MQTITTSALPEAGLQGEAFYQHWLEQLCGSIASVQSGLLAVKSGSQNLFQPVAMWPGVMAEVDAVADLIEQTIAQQAPLMVPLATEHDQSAWAIACPASANGQPEAVVALVLHNANDKDLNRAMTWLRWGIGAIERELLNGRLQAREQSHQGLGMAVDLLSRVLAEPHYDAAGMRLVSELAVMFNSDLVALGSVHNGSITTQHLSHNAQFTKRMNLVRALETAMEEMTDQQRTLCFPEASEQGRVVLAHKALAQQYQGEAILSIPLFHGDDGHEHDCIAAVTLLRAGDKPFTPVEIRQCESSLALIAAALTEKRLNDRPLWRKAGDSSRQQLQRLLGRGFLKRKLSLLALVFVWLYLTMATGEHRLSTEASLATVLRRVVVAPYDGYIRDALVRAGDQITAGNLLVALDDQELQLERLRWLSHQNRLERQYREAAATGDRARVNIIAAQQDQAEAELNLVESQITRAEQRAPFDGLVISGDLNLRLGGQVNKGEVLFEISPLDAYRVDLKIPEHRINDVVPGQSGQLHLSALPDHPYDFVVEKVIPQTVSEDGATWFIVEAHVQADDPQLRPGMEGIGKIELGETRKITIWTRDLIDWLRLKYWAWWS